MQSPPQFQYYSGERSLLIDNEVHLVNGEYIRQSKIEMENNISGFGANISPEMICRITQRFGLKLSYNLQLLNIHSGYNQEKLIANSVLGGLIFTFGNEKSFF